MNLETALAHARQAEADDLRGMYPMAARVLADEVVRSRVDAPIEELETYNQEELA